MLLEFEKNHLLKNNALLLHEPGGDGVDDGGAVGAGVGGRQGKEGGGEDEGLHSGGRHYVTRHHHHDIIKIRNRMDTFIAEDGVKVKSASKYETCTAYYGV